MVAGLAALALGTGVGPAPAAVPGEPATAAARVRECGRIGFAPNTDYGAFDIRARRVSCRRARGLARASRETSVVDGPFRYRSGSFRCRGVAQDQGLPTVDWTCRRGRAVVTFTRS